ncbi:MAG: hypothetical protein PQJ58_17210 [Spirochaetales bacterium]|nr:hypothetical protein [Spirochaetales bacterium]
MIDQIQSYDDVISPLVISKLQDKKNFMGMVSIGNRRADSLESVIISMINDTLKNCVGVQLDVAGEIVGMERENRDDESYRSLIFLKILINISSGEPEILIQAIQQLYGSALVDYEPVYPAKVRVWQDGEFGIYLTWDLESAEGDELTFMDGSSFMGRSVDESAQDLLVGLLPSGVDLMLAHTVIDQEQNEMTFLDGNDLIGVLYE